MENITGETGGDKSTNDMWGEAFEEEKTSKAQAAPPPPAPPKEQQQHMDMARPVSFGSITQESGGPSISNIDMVLDIPVTISVEIGRTKMIVRDLLQLGQGAVVELEKLAGEPMEILANGKLIARGEAVVINEKFGVKLTDIVSLTERINRLK